jgi:hypothetical protein
MVFKRFFNAESIFFFGLLLLAISLPLSPYLLSLSQFIIAFAWIISNNLELKLQKFFNNSAALIFCGVYMLHIVGVLWSSDYSYALKDLRIKLPLLILPLTLSSFQPIPVKRFNIILYAFTAAVFISTIVLAYKYACAYFPLAMLYINKTCPFWGKQFYFPCAYGLFVS